MTTDVSPVDVRRRSLRLAATGGLAFVVLYVVHLVLQGLGPDGSSGAAVAAYNIAHRGALRASEVAVGLALLAFIAFIAPLVPVIFAVTALAATISLAGLRTGLLWRWLGIAGLIVALVFLLGSVFSLLGSTPEGRSSLSGSACSSS